MIQAELCFDQDTTCSKRNSHGGTRPGAGLKKRRMRKGQRRTASHQAREHFDRWTVVHVVVRLEAGLPNLRRHREFAAIRECFEQSKDRHGMRLVHFSVLSNHMHLLVEAANSNALSTAMKALKVRIARALNKLWNRTGRVFAERFYAELYRAQARYRGATRNMALYVVRNARKHGIYLSGPDPFSSEATLQLGEPDLFSPLPRSSSSCPSPPPSRPPTSTSPHASASSPPLLATSPTVPARI